MLRAAKRPLMRISGRLCGEAIDAFLEFAARRRVPVDGQGLAGLDPRWARFAGSAAPVRAAASVRILVGNLAAANNVVFTEAYRQRRDRTADLWIVGVAGTDPVASRAASRLEPSLGALAGMIADAAAAAGSKGPEVAVYVNPVELVKSAGAAGEKTVLDTLERSTGRSAPGGGSSVRVVTLWNDRNAGYLFGRIFSHPSAPERPDLVLDAGTDAEADGARLVAWGLSPRKADLYLPLEREYWLKGRTHPSGGGSIVAGEVDVEALRASLPLG
jgi:hypothetical protein